MALTVIARNDRIFPANADTPSDLPEGDGLRQPSDDIAFVERAGLKAPHQFVVKQRIYIREHRENGYVLRIVDARAVGRRTFEIDRIAMYSFVERPDGNTAFGRQQRGGDILAAQVGTTAAAW